MPRGIPLTPQQAIRDFAQSILHGDAEHRQWLLDEAEKYCKKITKETTGELLLFIQTDS